MTGLGRGAGAVAALYGAVLIVGAATGGDSLLKPLARADMSHGGAQQQQEAPVFRPVANLREAQDAIRLAANSGRASMLDFYADWCVSCKELEAFTFPDARVREALADMQLLRVDVTENDADDKTILQHYNLFGPPALLFFAADETEIAGARLVGFINAEDFAAHVKRAKAAAEARR